MERVQKQMFADENDRSPTATDSDS